MEIKGYFENFYKIINKFYITDRYNHELDFMSTLPLIMEKILIVKNTKGIIYLIGNGGSSGIISHVSVDLLNTCHIRAVPLTDNSQITCFANDFGYENVYSKPLEVFLTNNDLLISVSSSGNSMNIINATTVASNKGCFVLTFTGFNPENSLRKLGDFNIWLESSNYGLVETGHALILHFLTDQIFNNRVK